MVQFLKGPEGNDLRITTPGHLPTPVQAWGAAHIDHFASVKKWRAATVDYQGITLRAAGACIALAFQIRTYRLALGPPGPRWGGCAYHPTFDVRQTINISGLFRIESVLEPWAPLDDQDTISSTFYRPCQWYVAAAHANANYNPQANNRHPLAPHTDPPATTSSNATATAADGASSPNPEPSATEGASSPVGRLGTQIATTTPPWPCAEGDATATTPSARARGHQWLDEHSQRSSRSCPKLSAPGLATITINRARRRRAAAPWSSGDHRRGQPHFQGRCRCRVHHRTHRVRGPRCQVKGRSTGGTSSPTCATVST
jgi:hypothetical protein